MTQKLRATLTAGVVVPHRENPSHILILGTMWGALLWLEGRSMWGQNNNDHNSADDTMIIASFWHLLRTTTISGIHYSHSPFRDRPWTSERLICLEKQQLFREGTGISNPGPTHSPCLVLPITSYHKNEGSDEFSPDFLELTWSLNHFYDFFIKSSLYMFVELSDMQM